MRTRPGWIYLIVGLSIGSLWLAGMRLANAQDTPAIRGPVMALRLDGDRLLIGQGSTLIEAHIASDGLQVIRAADLAHHEIRAIAVSQGITLVLSEDGVTTLDERGRVLDFVQGGGQRLAARPGRVYVAALEAGVRVLKVDSAGKLSRLGLFPTLGPATDLAAEADTWLWVAERDSGVRLYDTGNPSAPGVLLWLGNLTPATLVRVSGPRLIVGYGNRLSILDTLDIRSPRLLSVVDLDGADARVGDVIVQGSRAYVGRVESADADVVVLDLSSLTSVTVSQQFGNGGAGERLALHGDDLFIGSGRQGLRQVRVNRGKPELITAWEPLGSVEACTMAGPVLPQPANLSATGDNPVTLAWKSVCSPVAYEVWIDGTAVATVDAPTYTFKPQRDVTAWRVTAIDAAGHRTQGPLWTFESIREGWLGSPARAPSLALLYTPPPVLVELKSPAAVLLATCAASAAGLLVIVTGAWAVGEWSERRALGRER